jgi:hypothetical protein
MKNPMTATESMTRRSFAALVVRGSVGLVAVTAGCGGGGSSSTGTGSVPTQATRSRVLNLHEVAVRGALQSGFQTQNLAYARNSYYGSAPSGGTAGENSSGGADAPGASSPMPLLGAFLRNSAAISPRTLAARRRSRSEDAGGAGGAEGGSTGIGLPPDSTIPPPEFPTDPLPTFYFDYYLGLWVQIEETANTSSYLLFEDEGKARPAGHITTINPIDWDTFPQKFTSSYEFTRGYLTGSHGSSENITNADYGGSSRYENVYADGWKDKGASNWSGRGDFSWSSRTDGVNQEWSEGAGSFSAEGNGGMRLSSSDGYRSDYRYNADGSGHGRITGPDPGLPVTISWDAFGNTTIVYADGSIEHIPGWGSDNGGGAEPLPIDIGPYPA